MVAIETRFLGPTNYRGARYKAQVMETHGGKRQLTVECDHALGSEQNHYRAARLLIEKLGWFHEDSADTYGDWHGGGTDRGYVFVCALDYARLTREEER